MKDRKLWLALPTAALVGSLACDGGDAQRAFVERQGPVACVTQEVVYATPSLPVVHGAPPESEAEVRVYVDVSQPMGGFLPLVDTEVSDFQKTLSVLPEVLAHHYALGADGEVKWVAVSDQLRDVPGREEVLRRGAYLGSETALALALEDAVEEIMEGEVRAAVLVSDLVATGARVGGGQAAAGLLEWLQRDDVRKGAFGVGLLGIRGLYSGVRGRGCTAPKGSACRFSEDLGRWIPLSEVGEVPFYVVVLGRDAATVDAVGTRLVKDLAMPAERVRWELLNRAGAAPASELTCDFRERLEGTDLRKPQTTLLKTSDGLVCTGDDTVSATCTVVTSEGTPLDMVDGRTTWSAARLTMGSGIRLDVDCGAIRLDRSGAVAPLDVLLDVRPDAKGWTDWSDWSSTMDASDESNGKTLRLQYFVDALRVRPSAYRVACNGLLPSVAL